MEWTKTKNPKRAVVSSLSITSSEPPQTYDMVVFCHLRWQFVYQRPQHIISRMAKDLKILFIEEPLGFPENEVDTANFMIINENLHVLQPKVYGINNIKNILPDYVLNKRSFFLNEALGNPCQFF